MGTNDLRSPFGAVNDGRDPVAMLRNRDAFRVQAYVDALVLQYFLDGGGDVFVLSVYQARAHFYDGDFTTETPVHLAELQADIAASHNHQMLRQEIDFHHRRVREKFDLVESRHRRHDSPASHIDEDAFCREQILSYADLMRSLEASVPLIDRAVLDALQPAFDGSPGLP